jgi:hypothetical protein
MPALRQPPGADKPVSFDVIMDALKRLDRGDIDVIRGALDGRRATRSGCMKPA